MDKEKKVWNVSEVNTAVRDLIEGSFYPIWLRGEIGTLNIQRSGHVYMTMKDKNSQLSVVFFNGAKEAQRLNIQVGTEVEVFGNLSVYTPRGQYQLSIKKIQPVGLGNLQQEFELLKQKLSSEGLFDQNRKKQIAILPSAIGVVTSPTSAAVRDFMQVVERRFEKMNIKIYPAQVQGKGVEAQLVAGIEYFNYYKDVDVIVLTRGGGSMEDLWAFNEEVLARAIAKSDIPIISAIGHEIDFTICDFVADMRAPTPSAAGELVVARYADFIETIKTKENRILKSLELYTERFKRRLDTASNSYVFKEPIRMLRDKQQLIDDLTRTMEQCVTRKKEQNIAKFAQLNAQLSALSPYNVLKRGYSVLKNKETGNAIISKNIDSGTKVSAMVADGNIDLIVE